MSYNYNDYYSINKKKYKLKGALNLFLIELFVLVIWGLIVWLNYSTITKASSDSEIYVKRHYVADTNPSDLFEDDSTLTYEWFFWSIHVATKTTNSWSVEHKSLVKVSIDVNQAKRVLYLKKILDLWYIDKPTFVYLYNKNKQEFDITINDLELLANNRGLSLPQDISLQDEQITSIEKYLKDQDYKTLAHYLKWLDDKINRQFLLEPWSLILDAPFLYTNDFNYLLDKVHLDSNNFYSDHIKAASKIFNISPNIIKSMILTEQMRAAFTYRGRVKQIMETDTYLMVMSQSSYWVGWVKADTAIKLEDYLKINDAYIYNNYFAYPAWLNIYNERFARLTSTVEYKYQVYYIAGIIYKYVQDWKTANIDISKLPWIIATLYNVWDKVPTKSPKIWGSTLSIQWEKYTFWKLWMFLYYYLEIYWDSIK